MNLKIDHFYLVLNENRFQSLLRCEDFMKLCEHKTIVAEGGDESWEGLYFIGEDQIYFELVKESKKWGSFLVV